MQTAAPLPIMSTTEGSSSTTTPDAAAARAAVASARAAVEIVAWVGIALCTQQLNALLAAAGMASYLSGRAVATTRWYQDKFGEAWPSSRRHLIPGIF